MKSCSRCKVDDTTTPIYFDNVLVGQLCKICFLRYINKLDDMGEDTSNMEEVKGEQ